MGNGKKALVVLLIILLLVIIVAVVSVLLIGGRIGILAGGVIGKLDWDNISINSTYHYDEEGSFSIGSATLDAASISELDISWPSGQVELSYWNGNSIRISEDEGLSEDDRLRYQLDGDELIIRFCKNNNKYEKDLNKTLCVQLPEGMSLDEVDISTVSADVKASGLTAASLALENVSGNYDLSGSRIREFSCETVSGDFNITDLIVPEKIEWESVSGSIALYLPDNDGFSVDANMLNGSLSMDFPCEVRSDVTIYGNGSRIYIFNTVSGNLGIYRLDMGQ